MKTIDGEQISVEQLYHKHLNFIRMMAYKYRIIGKQAGLDLDDLKSIGTETLIVCYGKFDEGKGCKFLTYLGTAIRTRILRECHKNQRLYIPNYIYDTIRLIKHNGDTDLAAAEIAEKYECSQQTAEGVERFLQAKYIKLEDRAAKRGDLLVHEVIGEREDDTVAEVNDFISQLPAHYQTVVTGRMKEKKYKEISNQLGVSKSQTFNILKKTGKLWTKYEEGLAII